MKKIRDRFSGHSELYRRYRPHYPAALYQALLEYTPGRENYWDCATGNAQVAMELAPEFRHTYATDISENQLKQAPPIPRVQYACIRAESTGFKDDFFDLITVAQALHWFDTDAFVREACRVARPGGILAAWGYGLLRFNHSADRDIEHFYSEVVGPFWDGERRHIDTGYAHIELPLVKPVNLGKYRIEIPMDQNTLQGYLTSWSSVQNFIRKKGYDPVPLLMQELGPLWAERGTRVAVFPIFGTMGILDNQGRLI